MEEEPVIAGGSALAPPVMFSRRSRVFFVIQPDLDGVNYVVHQVLRDGLLGYRRIGGTVLYNCRVHSIFSDDGRAFL
jgi:hypothetical protein